MQEELNQYECNQVWHLVPRPLGRPTFGTKWIFRNKLVESKNVTKNKTNLMAQGYTQIEGIEFEKTFVPVGLLEAIRMTLAFTSFKDFKLFQMDVKSTFLKNFIEEEVYVEQPPEIVDPAHPDFVFKLERLYMV